VGQAVDTTYLATEELANSLGATFAEPMRESAQFAGVVRGVLKYRVLKRVQQEMVVEELSKKKASLEALERSEAEAQRIEQYLNSSGAGSAPSSPNLKRSQSAREAGRGDRQTSPRKDADNASIDSDFPPTHDGSQSTPSVSQGMPAVPETPESSPHKKSPSSAGVSGAGSFITNKIFGRISHAVHGLADVDPEKSRRDNIGKTKESIEHLAMAREASERDVREASRDVLKDLKRFQGEKEEDLRRYMVCIPVFCRDVPLCG
jgi:hypothetical protein